MGSALWAGFKRAFRVGVSISAAVGSLVPAAAVSDDPRVRLVLELVKDKPEWSASIVGAVAIGAGVSKVLRIVKPKWGKWIPL